ncbi:MAG: T9SS type A sorting domain-containing protein [Candidatus Krumholzibacteria bacterium]|nr:T9SS type A sorting domain-containing protein [Candidatus Krumholzibacteria bacterium]
MKKTAWLLVAALLLPAAALARRPSPPPLPTRSSAPPLAPYTSDRSPDLPPFRPAAASTTYLYTATFDGPGGCTSQGWTAVDMTAQTGEYFHVDDYAGLFFGPLAGSKSLWCGARPASTGPLCSYQTLPGYGNNWVQAWCTKTCIPVSGDLDVSFQMRLDTEPSYDAVLLHYTTDCNNDAGWVHLDGGIQVWDGTESLSINQAYDVGGASSVRVRLSFWSDGAWSDEDGLWDTEGAVHIDSLDVEGLALEDFEDEAVGATSSDDWISCNSAYGLFASLVSGAGVLQNQGDGCTLDVSCMWAFFVGSTSDYSCAGFPSQKTIPYVNAAGQYFHNEIWSPPIDLSQSGSTLILEYLQYNDFPGEALVFPTWSVRPIVEGCPRPWIDPIVYFYYPSGWTRQIEFIAPFVNTGTATEMQVSLGAVDMCRVWCGTFGSGQCHSHAPLYDNVKVYRVDSNGPQWSIRDIDQFQDAFEEIVGPGAGRARADMANDIAPGNHVNSIIPGDSSVVTVYDLTHGMGLDAGAGGPAVYCYVSVFPQGQSAKVGAGLTQNSTRWPVVGSWTDGKGTPWTCVRLDSCRVNGDPAPDRYCVDLNDNLFESGDTIFFFYSAKNAIGQETVAFGSNLALASDDRNQAAADPSEFTILPAGGVANGGDILYVDGMDGRGAQPYWETAFAAMHIGRQIDRYDIRGPTSQVSNRPAGRVRDISQLVPSYRIILWDCGDLPTTLGDGSGFPEKTNDYRLINLFLANLTPNGGMYLCGDDVPSQLSGYSGGDAMTFRGTYLPFNLTTGNHWPSYGISPVGSAVAGAWGGGGASDPTFVIHGSCPLLNDFDVMAPQGTTVNEITYGAGTAASANGALLRNIVGNARVTMSGFSFIYVRDDDNDGVSDRADLLYDILSQFGAVGAPTPASGAPRVTRLDANVPNPFNPQTSIAFSLAQRGATTLAVYDVAGRLVRTLLDETREAGAHTVTWDGRAQSGARVASGVYFYKLVTGGVARTRKMVLLK